jgi:hypothetical protein
MAGLGGEGIQLFYSFVSALLQLCFGIFIWLVVHQRRHDLATWFCKEWFCCMQG